MLFSAIKQKTDMQRHIQKINKSHTFRPFQLYILLGLLFLFSCKTSKKWEQSHLEPIDPRSIKNDANTKNLKKVNILPHLQELELPEEDARMLEQFYELNQNRLAWFNNNRLSRNVNQLLQNLGMAWTEGLPVERYQTGLIYEDIRQLKTLSEGGAVYPGLYAHLDIMLTHIYFQYAKDLHTGTINPQLLGKGWEGGLQPVDYPQVLHDALRRHRVEKSLEALKPQRSSYEVLSENLERLIEVRDEGGWEEPGHFETLRPGDSSPNVVRLKKFLSKTGDLRKKDSTYLQDLSFDRTLEMAVRSFQRRHGLKADGIPGEKTLEQMNRSIGYRIGQIKANLERMRWVPEHEEHYVLVNIPEFILRYYRNNKPINQMKVVVGKDTHHTPILSDTIRYVVFNPTWNVPPSIVREEMVHRMKSDSTYLERNQFMLFRGSYVSGDMVNPDSVNWKNITAENFPYFVVQEPGSHNSLGRVKFLFPNEQNIYLHDTPAQHRFSAYSRDFSHGCVRIEKPIAFASQLLKGQMTMAEINDILESKETTTITLHDRPVVYFIYQTAWVDQDGELNFREDLYDFDRITLDKFAERKKSEIPSFAF